MPSSNESKEWLKELVLEISNVVGENSFLNSLIHMNFYDGTKGQFEIFGIKAKDKPNGLPLVETEYYKLYVTKLPSGQFGLMKIATEEKFNEILENEFSLLTKAQYLAETWDREHIESKTTPPFYGAMFPKVIEEIAAGDRTAFFLGYSQEIENYKQLIPLSVITKDKRVDLQTTHWIFGKLLKAISYFHMDEMECEIGVINTSNVLIESNLHGVFVLDFSMAKSYDQNYISDVIAAAKIAWQIAGGTEENDPPYDSEIMSKENYLEYLNFLRRIIRGETKGAYDEFIEIYKLADKIWPKVPKASGAPGLQRQFHEFKTYSK